MRLKALGAALCALLFLAPLSALADQEAYHWLDDSTVAITTGNSSANVALKRLPAGDVQIRVVSNCATLMFIRKGADNTVAATASDLPIAPGEVEVLTIRNNQLAPVPYLAMISPSGSCTVYFTTGAGI